jgi:hypothetical protein
MVTLTYIFDGEFFDYEVDRFDIEKRLYEYLQDEWTQEELIEYIINNDGATFDYLVDFLQEIHDMFESEAEEFYYECKNSDNGVDQGDFI